MRWLAIAAMIAGVMIVPATAAADDKADALFKKGKKQLAEKRYAEACATFEKVDKLDPGIGAKLNVAKCYEDWGKLARSYRWYADAEKMAADTGDKRAGKIKELVDKLDPDVPRLTIKVTAGADLDAAAITLDGDRVAASALGNEARVDPGPHEIVFQVDGVKKTKTIALERGGAREVSVELASAATGKPTGTGTGDPKRPVDSHASEPRPGRVRRIAGGVIAGAGLVAVGVATYLTFDARASYRDALDAHCMGATNMCDDDGLQITHDARSRANVATAITVVGAAAIAAGVVLYLTAPKAAERKDAQAIYLAPVIGGDGGGLVLGGAY